MAEIEYEKEDAFQLFGPTQRHNSQEAFKLTDSHQFPTIAIMLEHWSRWESKAKNNLPFLRDTDAPPKFGRPLDPESHPKQESVEGDADAQKLSDRCDRRVMVTRILLRRFIRFGKLDFTTNNIKYSLLDELTMDLMVGMLGDKASNWQALSLHILVDITEVLKQDIDRPWKEYLFAAINDRTTVSSCPPTDSLEHEHISEFFNLSECDIVAAAAAARLKKLKRKARRKRTVLNETPAFLTPHAPMLLS
ncbi:hypothetical protein K469DRAFT_782338 [Zopfia rhizophila CBS 207.26]|uniref:Uncharacterized protein n=1 Tax=Zopfia rhizophila CBS 207.26 TaxID=1314779 RepID=A0A6A6ERN7_9PEZI|nr:hypothetical protein K469DRAFT_782338 [Zopfia rhizophila CBS 207.26]